MLRFIQGTRNYKARPQTAYLRGDSIRIVNWNSVESIKTQSLLCPCAGVVNWGMPLVSTLDFDSRGFCGCLVV